LFVERVMSSKLADMVWLEVINYREDPHVLFAILKTIVITN